MLDKLKDYLNTGLAFVLMYGTKYHKEIIIFVIGLLFGLMI